MTCFMSRGRKSGAQFSSCPMRIYSGAGLMADSVWQISSTARLV